MRELLRGWTAFTVMLFYRGCWSWMRTWPWSSPFSRLAFLRCCMEQFVDVRIVWRIYRGFILRSSTE